MKFEIAIVCAWFAVLIIQQHLLEAAIKKDLLTPFSARKICHVIVGLSVVPLAMYVRVWYLAAVPITIILSANVRANLKRGNLSRFEQRLFPIVGFLVPEILILSLWQQHSNIVVVSVLGMTVGDTAAAYVGIHLGRWRIPWTGKTVEGAVANFITSLAVLLSVGCIWFGLPAGIFAAVAVIISIVEALVPGAWDNAAALIAFLVLLGWRSV